MPIKNTKLAFFCLIISAFLIFMSQSAQSAESGPNLTVRIVPTSFRENGSRIIQLLDPSQHFHVVVTNTGKISTRLWREWCSWGYFSLSFEIRDQHGATAKIVKKMDRAWDKNFADWIVIPAGDSLVYEVSFDKSIWKDAPLPEPGKTLSVDLVAVFEVPDSPEAKTNNVWTGRVTSPTNTYTLYR
jgi:hypothetical protein